MEGIVLIPALVSAYVTWRYSLIAAFLNVYLPVLLLLPDYYRWDLPGLPDPTFSEAALLPIACAFAVRYLPRWRFSLLDFLVTGVVVSMAYSEYLNSGYAEAQNFAFNLIMMCLVPYMIGKVLLAEGELPIRVARRVNVLVAVVIVLSLYEFRFGTDPFRDIFQVFFPTQRAVWDTQLRWGKARIAGPYGSAILASIIFTLSLLMQQWLIQKKAWETRDRFDLGIPATAKKYIITIILLLGILFTMSRGPWLSLLFAAGVARLGWAKNLKQACLMGGLALVLLAGTLGSGVLEYASVGRSGASTAEQESAAYRKELIDKYMPIAEDGGLLGYGRHGWPKVAGMPSIDNYYLLLFLMHGFVGASLFVLLIVAIIVRLILAAFRLRSRGVFDVTEQFTLIACVAAVALAVATVYLDMQVMTLLYLLLGWAEGQILAIRSAPVLPDREAEIGTGFIVLT